MSPINRTLLAVVFLAVAAAQSPEPPLSDSRLSVHALVREDIFAGLLADDLERFSRGEKNIELLLEKRPSEKANLLAWRGTATLYRAVRAHEKDRAGEFQHHYRLALDLFSQAYQLDRGAAESPQLPEAPTRFWVTGCRRRIAPRPGHKPMTLTRRSGSSRLQLSRNCLCICGASFWPVSPSRPSGPAAPKRWHSTSTRYSSSCATPPTSRWRRNGKGTPRLPPPPASHAELVTSLGGSPLASLPSTVSDDARLRKPQVPSRPGRSGRRALSAEI